MLKKIFLGISQQIRIIYAVWISEEHLRIRLGTRSVFVEIETLESQNPARMSLEPVHFGSRETR